MKKPIVALMYDFDKTLCTKDMQEYGFIPSLGMSSSAFWGEVRQLTDSQEMDNILAYMYKMVEKQRRKEKPSRGKPLRNSVKVWNTLTELIHGLSESMHTGRKWVFALSITLFLRVLRKSLRGRKSLIISRKSTPVNLCMITPERFSGPNMLSITPQRHNSFSESIKAF